MRSAFLLLLLVGEMADARAPRPRASIDHAVLETNDLPKAMDEFERRTGVKPQFGGHYGGRGLRNAIVGLGNGRYLEIVGPELEGDAEDEHLYPPPPRPKKPPSPLRITPWSWAISTPDAMATKGRLQRRGFDVPPLLGSDGFRSSDYGKSSWLWFRVYDIDEKVSPFLIQWDRGTRHPSGNAPRGCHLNRISVATPQTATLRKLVAVLGLPVAVRPGANQLRLTLNCPKGRVDF